MTPSQIATEVQLSLAIATGIKIKTSATVVFNRVRVSQGTATGLDLVHDMPINQPGTYAGAFLPSNCALLVHKRTVTGGRRGRGRFFMPWMIREDKCGETGVLDGPEVIALQACFTAWLADLNTRSIPMAILHQPGNTAPGPPSLVTSLSVDPMVSTQRRRLGR